MTSKIYKYLSHDVLNLVFQRNDYCGLKCSLPKEYNDPYELFLGVDLNVPTDCLASYRDVIHELPQYPTSCFSISPVVSPMWAHYAKNHTGFVLEFDVEELKKHLVNVNIEKVEYKDSPSDLFEDLLLRVARIKKPRYSYMLLKAVFSEAYFSKYTQWSYEQEVRLVLDEGQIEEVGGSRILFVPISCVTALILGNKTSSEMVAQGEGYTCTYNIPKYNLEIGKSYPVPYMSDDDGNIFVYKNNEIVRASNSCEQCNEPIINDENLCPWCKITEAHKIEAAQSNPFRIMDHYGTLEDYIQLMDGVGKSKK